MKRKRRRIDPKLAEFSISHTRRNSNEPGNFYRVQLGKNWEQELRTRLNATVSQLEARLVFYGGIMAQTPPPDLVHFEPNFLSSPACLKSELSRH